MVAALFNSVETTKILLESGAYVNIRNGKGLTALDIAKNRNNKEVIAVLRQYGAR